MSIYIHTLKKEKKRSKNIHVQEIIPMKNKPHAHDAHTRMCMHTNVCTLHIHLTHTYSTHTHTHTHTTTTTPQHTNTHTHTHIHTHTHTHTHFSKRKAEQMMNIKVLLCTFRNGNEERKRETIHD